MFQNRNYVVFFYSYFVQFLISLYINTYISIFFITVLNVERLVLALIQLVSYSFILIRPLISLFFDKSHRVKSILIICSIGLIVSFSSLLFIFTLRLIVILIIGFSLGIDLALISILDVGFKKTMIIHATTEKLKSKIPMVINLGNLSSVVAINLFFIFYVNDYTSMQSWNFFFTFGLLIALPLVFITPFLRVEPTEISEQTIKEEKSVVSKKTVVLFCIFLFLGFSDNLFLGILPVWIIDNIMEGNPHFFSLFQMMLMISGMISFIAAGFFSNRLQKRSSVISSIFVAGFCWIVGGLFYENLFLFLYIISYIPVGFYIVNISSIMIEISKKNLFYYQLMTLFIFVAKIILTPLGTLLSSSIPVNFLIMASGVLILFSLFPFLVLKNSMENKD